MTDSVERRARTPVVDGKSGEGKLEPQCTAVDPGVSFAGVAGGL